MATHVLPRTDVRGLTGDLRARLVRPDPAGAGVAEAALEIVAAVRARGDAAVRELTERFDGCRLDDFAVGAAERDAALARLDPDLRAALEFARDQIVAWHEAQREKEAHHERSGIRVRELVVPVDRAGCYVPGGRAPLASSVLMTAAGMGNFTIAAPHWTASSTPVLDDQPGLRSRYRPAWPEFPRWSCARPRAPTARSTTPCSRRPRSPEWTRCTASAARRRSPRSRTALNRSARLT